MKTCTKCKTIKQKEEFYKKTAYHPKDDGYDYYCKVCRNEAAKKTSKTNKVKCTEQDCDRSNYARNLCRMHYDKSIRRERRAKK